MPFGILFALLCSYSSFAANLTAPVDIESVGLLPKGLRSPQFKLILLSPEDKFDSTGSALPLGQSLNKTVSWSDVQRSQKTEVDRNLLEGSVQAAGLSMSGSPGATTGQVNTALQVFTPILGYGLSEHLTLALAMPVYKVDLSVTSGFVKSGDGQTWVSSVCASEPLKCNEAANKLNDSVNQKLTSLGYAPLRSRSFSAFGDLKLLGKYLLSSDTENVWVLKPSLTLPTGRAPDVNQAVDLPTGDGQTDLATTLIWERKFNTQLQLTTFATYNLQWADRLDRRIPKNASDPLSEDLESVDRDLGDQISVGSGLGYGAVTDRLSFHLGYVYQFQSSTRFSGQRYSADRYRFLELQNPLQDIHSLTASATFSTIGLYRAKKFFYPFQTRLSLSQPLQGRNVVTSSVVTTDLVLFF